jgi:uncharacterized membrane protein
MQSRFRLAFNRLRQKLWVRPLAYCWAAVVTALLAVMADVAGLGGLTPRIDPETIEKLLSIIAASMLGVATFAVASMVTAYASASDTATPRAFPLVVADDFSKTALSRFIGAFIFSVVALVAIRTGYYGRAGLFLLFVLTIVVFSWVVVTFVRWVDQIARLGRLETTIDRVEKAATAAIQRRRLAPTLGGLPAISVGKPGRPVYASTIGYVQHIDMPALQAHAKKFDAMITVAALPGTFVGPGRPLAFLEGSAIDVEAQQFRKAFAMGDERLFDEDPRFGLIALSQIAVRALPLDINDPGTAIDIIGRLVRLFVCWVEPVGNVTGELDIKYDRVRVPQLSLMDMFDDAFTAIARGGAGTVEVAIRLQKAFISLASVGDADLAAAARHHSRLALSRAESALKLPEDIARVRDVASILSTVQLESPRIEQNRAWPMDRD